MQLPPPRARRTAYLQLFFRLPACHCLFSLVSIQKYNQIHAGPSIKALMVKRINVTPREMCRAWFDRRDLSFPFLLVLQPDRSDHPSLKLTCISRGHARPCNGHPLFNLYTVYSILAVYILKETSWTSPSNILLQKPKNRKTKSTHHRSDAPGPLHQGKKHGSMQQTPVYLCCCKSPQKQYS
jgi:hypothetical protein